MRVVKFTRSRAEIMQEASEYLADVADPTIRARVMIVLRLLAGETATDLSHEYGYSITAITTWARKVNTEGFQSLNYRPPTGRSMRLSPRQFARFRDLLRSSPADCGMPEYREWVGPAVQILLKRKFRMDFSLRQSQRLYRRHLDAEHLDQHPELAVEDKKEKAIRPNRLHLTGAAAAAAIASLDEHNVTLNPEDIDLSEYDPRIISRPDSHIREQKALKNLITAIAKEAEEEEKKKKKKGRGRKKKDAEDSTNTTKRSKAAVSESDIKDESEAPKTRRKKALEDTFTATKSKRKKSEAELAVEAKEEKEAKPSKVAKIATAKAKTAKVANATKAKSASTTRAMSKAAPKSRAKASVDLADTKPNVEPNEALLALKAKSKPKITTIKPNEKAKVSAKPKRTAKATVANAAKSTKTKSSKNAAEDAAIAEITNLLKK